MKKIRLSQNPTDPVYKADSLKNGTHRVRCACYNFNTEWAMGRQSKYSEELKMQILKEVEEVGVIATVAKKHGIDSKNIHNWLRVRKNKPKLDQARELRELRKKLDDAELENLVLKELLKKTYPRWQNAETL